MTMRGHKNEKKIIFSKTVACYMIKNKTRRRRTTYGIIFPLLRYFDRIDKFVL